MQITNGIGINPQYLTLTLSASQLLFLIQEAGPFLLFFFSQNQVIYVYIDIYTLLQKTKVKKKNHIRSILKILNTYAEN